MLSFYDIQSGGCEPAQIKIDMKILQERDPDLHGWVVKERHRDIRRGDWVGM